MRLPAKAVHGSVVIGEHCVGNFERKFSKGECNAVLRIHADAPQWQLIDFALQTRDCLKFRDGGSSVHGLELAQNAVLQIERHTFDRLALKDRLSGFVCEMNDHGVTIR